MQSQPDTAADLDTVLAELLEEDLLDLMLTPPLTPAFTRDTVRPGRPS